MDMIWFREVKGSPSFGEVVKRFEKGNRVYVIRRWN
jgi:hypothetical protein